MLLNDLKAIKLVKSLGLKFTWTLSIIYKAKQMSIIKKVKPLINKLLLTNFHVSKNIISEFLKLNNE